MMNITIQRLTVILLMASALQACNFRQYGFNDPRDFWRPSPPSRPAGGGNNYGSMPPPCVIEGYRC
jgi:hypothetical protein